MIRSAYNLQEVLAPLMARFGRRMWGERGEMYEMIVTTVCEALEVERQAGIHLVEALCSAQLLDFERTDRPEPVTVGSASSGEPDENAENAENDQKQFGVFNLGPRL